MQAGFNASVRWAAAREGRWADGDEQASRGVRPLHRGRTLFGQRVSRQIEIIEMPNVRALLPILASSRPGVTARCGFGPGRDRAPSR